ncbi:LysR family transcriptional regulator [Motilibacter aurantiacus]|uniref:LysR family transcriptional regulator n=1 Tax=Motilibacter aurantiacus TaxID=2714955 RepID=UPI00140802D2|nr:LysR family transcriptional regulator [Motilibacter aurantiacus]NHC43677.1 LysR family transcriptional regulator [Motilibacter aurantiacus]
MAHDGTVLDVRRLRVLKTVVDTGSVTAAAQALSYTPSAVSQQLSALEREAGTPLFEKAGRGLRPTAAGTLLAEHAGGVLSRLEEAEQALVTLRAGQAGQLSMVVLPSALSGLLPGAVGQFRRQCPQVALDLRPGEADDAFPALRSGAADLIVAVQPGSVREIPDDGLVYTHLLDDCYKVVLPKQHRLAARRQVDMADLVDEDWVTTASCPGYCQLPVQEAWAAAGFTPRTGMDADDFPAAQGYVAAGLGVALIPRMALSSLREDIVVRRLRGEEPFRRLFAVTRPTLTGDIRVSRMIEALKSVVPAQLATASA